MTRYTLVVVSGEGHVGIHQCVDMEAVQSWMTQALSLSPKSVTFHVINNY